MNRLCLCGALAFASLSLASCATVATSQRCEAAAAGLRTLDQVAQVFINSGVEVNRAHKIAEAVLTGQLLLSVACAQAGVP